MKYSEARQGRIFVIRLEDGEVLHEEIERFSSDRGIRVLKKRGPKFLAIPLKIL